MHILCGTKFVLYDGRLLSSFGKGIKSYSCIEKQVYVEGSSITSIMGGIIHVVDPLVDFIPVAMGTMRFSYIVTTDDYSHTTSSDAS